MLDAGGYLQIGLIVGIFSMNEECTALLRSNSMTLSEALHVWVIDLEAQKKSSLRSSCYDHKERIDHYFMVPDTGPLGRITCHHHESVPESGDRLVATLTAHHQSSL